MYSDLDGRDNLFNRVENNLHELRYSNRARDVAKSNARAHYGLGHDFYRLWLDPTMTYSAAKFSSLDQSLEAAQIAKYDVLCQKLRLRADDHQLGGTIAAKLAESARTEINLHARSQFAASAKRIADRGLFYDVCIDIPHFFSFRSSAVGFMFNNFAAASTLPPPSVSACLILSCSFQSWITRYSVRSPMPRMRAASSRLPAVCSSVFSV